MSGFKNWGVPWYARSDTPSPRPREIKIPNTEWIAGKVHQMKARQYVIKFMKDNWKDGDKFFVTHAMRDNSQSIHHGHFGVFHKIELQGTAWWAIVEWIDYKPRTGGRMGMFDFFHFAFRLEENGDIMKDQNCEESENQIV